MSVKIVIAGNPNSGKSTLFNLLSGSKQYTGNRSGVTVEVKESCLKSDKNVIIADLPGIYSLSPNSLEEVIARDYLLNKHPNAIINVVDAANPERHLYLTLQLLELNIPVIIAFNRIDEVKQNGGFINLRLLSSRLGCSVAEISALKNLGIEKLIEKTREAALQKRSSAIVRFNPSIEFALGQIERKLPYEISQKRFYSIRLFERDAVIIKKLSRIPDIESIIHSAELENDTNSESLIISERYSFINKIVEDCFKNTHKKSYYSNKVDSILTNRFLSFPIFIIIVFLIYFLSVSLTGKITNVWINSNIFGENGLMPLLFNNYLNKINCVEWLKNLIINGIITGIGAVFGFIPQLFVLFAMLSILEESGYMARIAFILDVFFKKFGLSGKSFIPILVGSGCGVSGIMASRTIENDTERKITITVATFIPCGAKLPVIALISGVFFGGAWWTAPSAYFIGILSIIVSGIILKKLTFSKNEKPLIIELPAYRLPAPKYVIKSAFERTASFIKKAGAIIIVSSAFIWILSNFGFINGRITETSINSSFLALFCNNFKAVFKPLGWDNWQAVAAVFTGFAAKENIVGTLKILYNSENTLLSCFNKNSAYSFLIFNLLCMPCFSAVAAIYKELNSFKLTVFSVCYQTLFAYFVSFCIYQYGTFLNGSKINLYITIAFIMTCSILLFLLKPYKNKRE